MFQIKIEFSRSKTKSYYKWSGINMYRVAYLPNESEKKKNYEYNTPIFLDFHLNKKRQLERDRKYDNKLIQTYANVNIIKSLKSYKSNYTRVVCVMNWVYSTFLRLFQSKNKRKKKSNWLSVACQFHTYTLLAVDWLFSFHSFPSNEIDEQKEEEKKLRMPWESDDFPKRNGVYLIRFHFDRGPINRILCKLHSIRS